MIGNSNNLKEEEKLTTENHSFLMNRSVNVEDASSVYDEDGKDWKRYRPLDGPEVDQLMKYLGLEKQWESYTRGNHAFEIYLRDEIENDSDMTSFYRIKEGVLSSEIFPPGTEQWLQEKKKKLRERMLRYFNPDVSKATVELRSLMEKVQKLRDERWRIKKEIEMISPIISIKKDEIERIASGEKDEDIPDPSDLIYQIYEDLEE